MTDIDKHFMQRCLQLAAKGIGYTAPNPLVGSVIVHQNKIIGEGYHQKFGEAHAEVNAVNSVKDTELLQHSTLYVNLEPCSHYGKTPPCVDLIIENKIPKVVIANEDINPLVSGKGIARLKESGCEVVTGVCSQDAEELNKRFFTFHKMKRPYIILKWAQSKNGITGFIDPDKGSLKISGEEADILVHKWRSEEQAIMIAVNTFLIDNPVLNVRKYPGKSPVRILIDPHLKSSKHDNNHLFNNMVNTYVFNQISSYKSNKNEFIQINEQVNWILAIMNKLYDLNIQSVLVEGGRTLHQSLINAQLWDEIRIIKSEKIIADGIKSPTLPAYNLNEIFFAGKDEISILKPLK